MFICRKFDSERNRTRVQIVHSVRDGSKVRQNMLRHVDIAIATLNSKNSWNLATVIMEEMKHAHSAQQPVFTPQQYADLIAQSKPDRTVRRFDVDFSECRKKSHVSVGVHEALGEIYRHLGWDQPLRARHNRSSARLCTQRDLRSGMAHLG